MTFSEKQTAYENKTTYENLIRRSWNYLSPKELDPSVFAYGHFQNVVGGHSFRKETPEKAFEKLQINIAAALKRFSDNRFTKAKREALKDLADHLVAAIYLSQIDAIVQHALEITHE